MMYSECGSNPDTKGRTNLNCLDNGPSRPMNTTGAKALLRDLCPTYDPENTCCDLEQLSTIQVYNQANISIPCIVHNHVNG